MAYHLLKPQVIVSSTIEMAPANSKYFHITATDIPAGQVLTIAAAAFFQDNGSVAAELPPLLPKNSYYNVYINGVLQMEGISLYTPGRQPIGKLKIFNPPDGEPLLAGTPLLVYYFLQREKKTHSQLFQTLPHTGWIRYRSQFYGVQPTRINRVWSPQCSG